MFCSTIIPTVGRELLEQSVQSVLAQNMTPSSHELIVVNDSGKPLSKALQSLLKGATVLSTHRRERCVARNLGAAVARGKYLHFLDDDDVLFPGAFEQWWKLAQRSDADWLYGKSHLISRTEETIVYLDHGMEGNFLYR